MQEVPIGELARLFEVDPKAIRQLVERGQLERLPNGMFDLEKCVEDWNTKINHNYGHNNRNPNVVAMRQRDRENLIATSSGEIPDKPSKGNEYLKARAAVQIWDARLKKLRYEERAKNLAPTHAIESAKFQEMRIVRDACFTVPARLSAQLAAEGDEHRVYQLLENELLSIFEDYSEGRMDELEKRIAETGPRDEEQAV